MSKRPENSPKPKRRLSTTDSVAAGGTAQKVRLVEIDEEVGQRIDNFLLKQLGNVPKSRVYRMLRSGEVRVNGGRKKPIYRLQAGDTVRIPPHRAGPVAAPNFISDGALADLEAAIVFEDEQLLVVNKPAGLAVHGGSGVSYGLIEAIRRIRGDGVELAHRLDRDTSGCLLLAKRRSALRTLHDLIRQGRLLKRYRLIVSGQWPRDLETVKLPLHKYHTGSGERRVRVAAEGKPSHTDFHLVERCDRASLLDADLITGRTHQIRVHAQASGYPLIGDQKYATDEQLAGAAELGISRLCLHAERVVLPWGGDSLTFTCPVPTDMQQAWRRLQDPSA